MQWQGEELGGNLKTKESQFAGLMQQMLHHCEKGVSRDMLEAVLFEGRDLDNPHHALQTVIYNAKKRLRRAGLPDVNYIEQRKGIFYWTDQLPVQEDAAEFDSLCQKAEEAETPKEKLSFYLRAAYLYTGEFLPAQAGVLWVAQESRRYRERFCDCVEKAAALLRENNGYTQLRDLGLHASRVDPLADWERIAMEALACMGRWEEARKLYDDTVEFYLREQGLRPSEKLTEIFQGLGDRVAEHGYAALDVIQSELEENNDRDRGGYLCSYPVFEGIYRMIDRMMERGGQSVYLMLCTIVDSKGNPMQEGPVLEELSQRLEESVRGSVRRGDAICRYGKGQFLVLLVNTTRESCDIIQKRIRSRFIIGRQRTGVRYYVNSVVCPAARLNQKSQGAS